MRVQSETMRECTSSSSHLNARTSAAAIKVLIVYFGSELLTQTMLELGCIPMRRIASVASVSPEMFAGSVRGPTMTFWLAKSIRGQCPCLPVPSEYSARAQHYINGQVRYMVWVWCPSDSTPLAVLRP